MHSFTTEAAKNMRNTKITINMTKCSYGGSLHCRPNVSCAALKICYTMIFNEKKKNGDRIESTPNTLTIAPDNRQQYVLQKTCFIWHIFFYDKKKLCPLATLSNTHIHSSCERARFVGSSLRCVALFFLVFSLMLASFFISCSHSDV